MKTFSFHKKSRIRKRVDYLRIQKRSHRFHTKHLLICSSYNSKNTTPRIGIVATKKIGNAVARNRGKRLVREAFRRNQHLIQNLDVVVILKTGINESSQTSIDEELFLGLKKKR